MSVKIGHASIDEHGNIAGGKAGDQTGKEVCTREWYNKGWSAVIRPKDAQVAEKIARTMAAACANKNIGYDQKERNTLYREAAAKNWDIASITKPCETDCSALVRVCVCAAGIQIPDVYTGNLAKVLEGTKRFKILTGKEFTQSDKKLKRGDILLKAGSHTAVVLTNGSAV